MIEQIKLSPEERVLFIINDNVISGKTRFQKYGFLLSKQYQDELKELQNNYDDFTFYDDWIPHYFGPYSKELQNDVDICVTKKLLSKIQMNNTQAYALTLKGRVRWREFFSKSPNTMKKINEKIVNMQTNSLYVLLRSIYDAYPDYAINSQIQEELK